MAMMQCMWSSGDEASANTVCTRALLHNGIIIDTIGWEKSYLNAGWDIAGVPRATAGYSIVEHILLFIMRLLTVDRFAKRM